MKKILLVIIILVAICAIFAQNPLRKGETQFNAGFGFSDWGVPIYVGLDYGVDRDITFGGELSFNSYREDYDHHYYNHSIIGVSANGNYHFNRIMNIPRNWDFYAGLNVGFYSWNSPSDYHGDHSTGLGLGAQIGGRYCFSSKTAINLEFGGGNAFSGGKIGITVKL
jgi:outer membrane immunogenic protein